MHQRNCDCNLLPVSLDHIGHVVDVKWICDQGHNLKWASSSQLGNHHNVNYKMMSAYLCSGMTQVQYERLSEFADFGIMSEHFRNKSAVTFSAIIEVLAKESVHFALFDECQISKEKKEDGITIMTDARHHCRKNSYHTDHVALGQHTHKVINIQHITKQQDRCTQRHENIGCNQMYDDFERKGVKINIHSHDRNMSVNKTIRTKDTVKNCNERWHATKPLTQGLKKISSGARRNMGKTWHPELADKGSRIRNHMYYAMDNCAGNPDTLRQLIDNSILHFQNNHDNCADDSACKEAQYVPEFTILSDPVATRLLTDFLHSLTLYKNAADYTLSKDTYYVESFNNSCLMYLQKRIHYKEMTYSMRINLAVLNWNEHVDRPFTSRRTLQQVHHNRRYLGKKAYKKKTYMFVNDIWQLLIRVIEDGEQLPDININLNNNQDDNDDDHYYDEISED